MARINSNVPAMIAQHNLAKSQANLQVRLQRLSTGLRINRGADDPAGLIISERLRSEIQGIGAAIGNAERATNVIATAEASLAEVADLLTSVKSLIIQAANTGAMSQEEIEANQLQVDDAVASISRIANTATFAGLKLLNGSLGFVTSSVNGTQISDLRISQATFGTDTQVPVTVDVMASAEKGQLILSTGSGVLTSAVNVEVGGLRGIEVLNFTSGTTLSMAAYAINRTSDSTGIEAIMSAGAGGAGTSALIFRSLDYGSEAFVSVKQLGTNAAFWETYDQVGGSSKINRDTGEDVVALVNGTMALGDGLDVKLRTSTLNVEMSLTESFGTQTATDSKFNITGGGAVFQVGPVVETSQQVSFGVDSVHASRLGSGEIGFLSDITSTGDKSLIKREGNAAGRIVDKAITQVSVLRGRLGAFERNTLQPNVRSLQIALENVTSSESQIRDADFAKETSELTRAQVLVNVGTTVLTTANSTTASVLQLLQ